MSNEPAFFRHDHATGVRVQFDEHGRVSQLMKHLPTGSYPVGMSHASAATIALTINGVSYPISPEMFVCSAMTPGA